MVIPKSTGVHQQIFTHLTRVNLTRQIQYGIRNRAGQVSPVGLKTIARLFKVVDMGKQSMGWFSLPGLMIIMIIFLVGLTTAVAGLPALWVIHNQLDRQAWAQIEQGQRVVKALYAARRDQLVQSAILIAQRPTLPTLLGQASDAQVEDYLEELLISEELDLIAVCGDSLQMQVHSIGSYPPELCGIGITGSFYHISGEILPQVWLFASHMLGNSETSEITVFVGLHLDNDFAKQTSAQTGLEHAILVNGEIVATSYTVNPIGVTSLEPRVGFLPTPEVMVCCTFALSERPHYASRMAVEDGGFEVELALDITAIEAAERQLRLFITVSMLVVAGLGSLVGIYLSRRIYQPLASLVDTAEQFRQGDLSSPVEINTQVREVIQLSKALEGARTELLNILTHLSQERAWNDHLLNSIVEGIVTLDDEYKITFFSRGAERILGWTRAEVINRSCDEVFNMAESGDLFSQAIPPPEQKKNIVVTTADGGLVSLSVTRAQLTPTDQAESQLALVFRDVSQEEIIHRFMGYFLANIVHEFRTPLSALAASLELLMHQTARLKPEEIDELLNSLHLGVISLQSLVDNLLESASIEAGRFRVAPRVYDLEVIIRSVVTTLTPLLEKYGQKLELQLPANIPLVKADPRRIEQVLVNLLANANKYGPPNEEIDLSVEVLDGWVKVNIADRGPGIPFERRESVFKRFERYNPDQDRATAGVGLGLSVVQAVVEAHSGKTGVADRPGGGSIFWFTLPIVREI